MADAQATWIKLFLLEDVFFSSGPGSKAMVESLWSLMPEELVEKVLLFLPASSQARFCSVCKRWRELLTTLKFREETALMAFRRGYPVCILNLVKGGEAAAGGRPVGWCKWRKVEMPGLLLPPNTKLFGSGGGRLPFVGVGSLDAKAMRCCLLNIVEQTWRELPRLDLAWDGRNRLASSEWTVWLVPAEGTNGFEFSVFVLDGTLQARVYLHRYRSTSNQWETICPLPDAQDWLEWRDETALISTGRYCVIYRSDWPRQGLGMVRVSWDGTPVCPLPDIPQDSFIVFSDSQSDLVFALGPDEWRSEEPGLFLYKLKVAVDESNANSSQQWECVFSGKVPPPGSQRTEDVVVRVCNAQIVGHMVLVLAIVWDTGGCGARTNWAMAYHMLEHSCQWQRVHLPMDKLRFVREPGNLFVSPTISKIS